VVHGLIQVPAFRETTTPAGCALAIHFKQARTREKDEKDFTKLAVNADNKTNQKEKHEQPIR